MNSLKNTFMKANSITAFMAGYAQHDPCPLCDSDAVIEVITTITIADRRHGRLVINNYSYSACENPECEFEFVSAKQSKYNDNQVLLAQVTKQTTRHRGMYETESN